MTTSDSFTDPGSKFDIFASQIKKVQNWSQQLVAEIK